MDCKYTALDFKDVRGVYKTESLFCETISPQSKKSYTPLYTLKDHPHRGLPSAYEIYAQAIDEYDAAMSIVGSMAHWNKLCSLKWFLDGREGIFRGINAWRDEMKARDRSIAKKTLLERVKEGDVSASRALLNLAEDKNTRGRAKKPKLTPEVPSHLVDHVINFSKR